MTTFDSQAKIAASLACPKTGEDPMRKLLAALFAALALTVAVAVPASADPVPPTNGGSNLGGGQSGQCAGPLADRPASCG